MNTRFFLPGQDKQMNFLTGSLDVTGLSVLIIGAGCEEIARTLAAKGASKVIVIVNDNDYLLTSRLLLSNSGINVRLMDYDNTDFKDASFDLVYAQASVSNIKRAKITKEVYRILKEDGLYCLGENTSLSKDQPKYIADLWQNAGVSPLFVDDLESYYKERKFNLVKSEDLSFTLNDFYTTGITLLTENLDRLSDQEKSYYKKLVNIISHESNVYLRLGGDKHIGFHACILKKGGL